MSSVDMNSERSAPPHCLWQCRARASGHWQRTDPASATGNGSQPRASRTHAVDTSTSLRRQLPSASGTATVAPTEVATVTVLVVVIRRELNRIVITK